MSDKPSSAAGAEDAEAKASGADASSAEEAGGGDADVTTSIVEAGSAAPAGGGCDCAGCGSSVGNGGGGGGGGGGEGGAGGAGKPAAAAGSPLSAEAVAGWLTPMSVPRSGMALAVVACNS